MAGKYEVPEGGDDDNGAPSRKSSSVAEWSDAVEGITNPSNDDSSTNALLSQPESSTDSQPAEQQKGTLDLKDLNDGLLDELGLEKNDADQVVHIGQESEPATPTDWADGTTYEDDPDRLDNDALREAAPTTAFLLDIRNAFTQREYIQEQIDDYEARLADLRDEAAKYDAVLEGVKDIVNQGL
uniref:EKC/KEOPS complex subunit GON7 n=1 Tax=Panagrellus redivivus TaxID=6233 RepID=A0A7E5A068_PANRE